MPSGVFVIYEIPKIQNHISVNVVIIACPDVMIYVAAKITSQLQGYKVNFMMDIHWNLKRLGIGRGLVSISE